MKTINDSTITPCGIWPSKHMPKNRKSGDSYSHLLHNSRPALSWHNTSSLKHIHSHYHPTHHHEHHGQHHLDDPRFLPPNASPHKPNTSRTAAKWFQWISLCPILSSLSKRMIESIHEVLQSAWTSPGPDTTWVLLWPHISASSRTPPKEWTTKSTSYTLTERNFACTWWPNK